MCMVIQGNILEYPYTQVGAVNENRNEAFDLITFVAKFASGYATQPEQPLIRACKSLILSHLMYHDGIRMVHRINSYIAAAFPQLLTTTFSSRWRKDFGNLPLETFTHPLSHSSLSRLRPSFKSVPSFICKYSIVVSKEHCSERYLYLIFFVRRS